MIDDETRRTVERALERLMRGIAAPRVLTLLPDRRFAVQSAIERARAQWLGPSEPVLTVALAGGTGAGKSTLINALAGTTIAEASEIRPTTRHIQVYHHREDSLGSLPDAAANEAAFVAHDRPELRHKMLVDAPDLDSFVVRHRATTKALLKRSSLVVYVFSPERYLEERTWSILRTETEYSAAAAVLNKVDRVGSPEELEQITEDLRAHFAAIGQGNVRIFRLCARAHVPDGNGVLPNLAPVVDDMVALRAYIERELHGSEIARLLRSQREAVVAHLKAEVDRLAPETLSSALEQLPAQAAERAENAATELAGALAEPLAAVEAELAPLLTLKRHEAYWGPFRLWLTLTDFCVFGLTSLVRRVLGGQPRDRAALIERLLERGSRLAVDDVLRAVSLAVQDILYARDLPIARWREITAEIDAHRAVGQVAREIEGEFDLSSARLAEGGRTVVWLASTLGGLIPAAFVVVGLVVMTRDLMQGHYSGPPLLWHLTAMVVLFFLVLQGLVGILAPVGSRGLGTAAGRRAVHTVIRRTVNAWVSAYRADLESDLADLREPLVVLARAVTTEEPTRVPAGEG